MKLVDALTVALRDWDVRYVFGVSGANIEHFHDAIHRLGEGRLVSIMAKSEVGAAFMADCRARVHRTLGVCCATSGGGMMNLAVGIAEAYSESVPMLAIVGQVPSALEGRGGFQDSSGVGRTVNALGMFGAMAKMVARIDRPERFWEILFDAARAAVTGRPGPSVLLVPRDAYELEVGPRPSWFPATLADLARERSTQAPDSESMLRLFEAIRGAARPVLVLGTGAERCSDRDAIRRFAVATRTPIATTMASPGAYAHDDPLYLGTVGAAGHPSAHAYLNDEADLLIAVGTGLNIMTRNPLGPALARARVAAVNVDPTEIVATVSPALVVTGEAGLVFQELERLLERAPFTRPPLDYTLTRYMPRLAAERPGRSTGLVSSRVERARTDVGENAPLLQSEAIELLEPYLPSSGHVLFDAGNCAAAALHGLTLPRDTSATIALGMGGMGYAIAGAIGAQLGEVNERRSIVLCGDGAFLMMGLEIHTAVELGLPILFVVFNNNQHGMCVSRQTLFFEGRVECAEYGEIRVADTVRGLGAQDGLWIGRAGTRAELMSCLTEYDGLTGSRPGVLELVLTREEVPPFGPLLGKNPETYVVRRQGLPLAPSGRSAA